MSIEGFSQALAYYSASAAQTVQSLSTATTGSEKSAVISEYKSVGETRHVQDFVDEYVPSRSRGEMSASLAMARQKSNVFIDEFVQAANMFDHLIIAQQKADIFIDSLAQSAQVADAFVDQFLTYKP
jgi:hypothetical protein